MESCDLQWYRLLQLYFSCLGLFSSFWTLYHANLAYWCRHLLFQQSLLKYRMDLVLLGLYKVHLNPTIKSCSSIILLSNFFSSTLLCTAEHEYSDVPIEVEPGEGEWISLNLVNRISWSSSNKDGHFLSPTEGKTRMSTAGRIVHRCDYLA